MLMSALKSRVRFPAVVPSTMPSWPTLQLRDSLNPLYLIFHFFFPSKNSRTLLRRQCQMINRLYCRPDSGRNAGPRVDAIVRFISCRVQRESRCIVVDEERQSAIAHCAMHCDCMRDILCRFCLSSEGWRVAAAEFRGRPRCSARLALGLFRRGCACVGLGAREWCAWLAANIYALAGGPRSRTALQTALFFPRLVFCSFRHAFPIRTRRFRFRRRGA